MEVRQTVPFEDFFWKSHLKSCKNKVKSLTKQLLCIMLTILMGTNIFDDRYFTAERKRGSSNEESVREAGDGKRSLCGE